MPERGVICLLNFFSRRGLRSDKRALGVTRAKLAKDTVKVRDRARIEHLNVKNVQLRGSSSKHVVVTMSSIASVEFTTETNI